MTKQMSRLKVKGKGNKFQQLFEKPQVEENKYKIKSQLWSKSL